MPKTALLHADYPALLEGETSPRTVGGQDITTFACLTGDYNRIHLDEHYGASLPYGSRIAHGLISGSWALGSLSQEAPLTVGRRHPEAYLSGCEVNYRSPVLPGDTLRCRWRMERQAAEGRGFGPVQTRFQMLNQRDEPVTDGHLLLQLPASSGARLPDSARVPWPAEEFDPVPGRVYFLEDFQPGSHAGQTEGRTLTEADVVGYGGFTGDNGGHHGDAEFARAGRFGARIVQPMLAFDIGFALWLKEWCRMGTPDSGQAGHLCDRWQAHAPFYLGDTLRCRYRTLSARTSRTRPGMGLLTCGLQMLNQRDAVALSAEVVMMYPTRQG
ncbi:MaoC family dehydratase [Denitratisoma oestradiolicum]|uniref:MaoC-like domain-containing protein n=1 Tax=Denitratisoma oestradiolicum TaxID=311182 RepID=A0A6S6XXN2_9PROT|nr:MaoC/PaaZ C-terminal domain-containing protein [Denitratisoma oestradiolicum]TWO79878.1 hypothetical protein CBW56_12280 [Denitratisoma oestradiolicum]CAB1369629.1 conserved protein of unknown function [Denitratisoma oestradiolicum]